MIQHVKAGKVRILATWGDKRLAALPAELAGRLARETVAGSGELLRAVRGWLAGREKFLVGAELNAKAARAIYRGSARGDINALQCDALQLPFADSSFDYIYCSLFLHHMADGDAVRCLRPELP